ncbi:protoporphyrin IX magnesium-chelatase [Roseiarcus fermentans]|uniref:Mg-protoporphyrin IX chelatase n=1 Tax=Roseiarcus fermentans TaxID=1473586 RepID=A0A366FC85_9HYPH|nr:magnesium chelatase ATPase subunit I [Roseiarcus fermentans]RBP11315.1 protoporphyrin IX magnesium-chelatase [Roseiarcus fermentans]
MRQPYPFSAIVGQDEMKLAFLIAAVDPSIGGILAFGDRGTGKSTAVRALAALLPKIKAVEGCPYNCEPSSTAGLCRACGDEGGKKPKATLKPAPVVDLPLGATEDRVVGALNLERALAHGEKSFQPGLLAQANRGFLYIDECNLLEDHLVDLLLDVAASGINVVEREGLSVRHPARFVLIGSGNPEEGELRPQLLDRFGLAVEVRTPQDVPSRIEVVKRRDAYDRDPDAFLEQWAPAEKKLCARIVAARAHLASVATPDAIVESATRLCLKLGSDGLRGELTLIRAARALASLDKKHEIHEQQLKRIAPMALSHRLRRNPLDETGSSARVQRAVEEVLG